MTGVQKLEGLLGEYKRAILITDACYGYGHEEEHLASEDAAREAILSLFRESAAVSPVPEPSDDEAPRFVCGPTCGCGKSMPMERTPPHVFPAGWQIPERCPNCGKQQRGEFCTVFSPPSLDARTENRIRALEKASTDEERTFARMNLRERIRELFVFEREEAVELWRRSISGDTPK